MPSTIRHTELLEDTETTSGSTYRRNKPRVITVELLIAVYSLVEILRSIHIETLLAIDSGEANKVNKNIILWKRLENLIVPVIMMLVLGSYSDDHRLRKPLLLMPILGELLAMIVYILFALFTDKFPIHVIIAVNLILPFFGTDLLFMGATLAFIADITDRKTRTFRLATAFLIKTVCLAIYQILYDTVLPKLNILTIMTIMAVLSLFGLFYGSYSTKGPPQEQQLLTKALVLDAFTPKHILKTFSVLKNEKPKLLAGILCVIVVRNIVSYGFYVDVSWIDEIDLEIGDFLNLSLWVQVIGLLAGMLLVKLMKLDDSIILALAFIDKIASKVILGYAKNHTMVHVATILDMLSQFSLIVLYSMVTKMVSPGDHGKILSVVTIIGRIIYGLYFTHIVPSPPLYLGNILYSLCLPFILWLCVKSRKNEVQVLPNTSDRNDEHNVEVLNVV